MQPNTARFINIYLQKNWTVVESELLIIDWSHQHLSICNPLVDIKKGSLVDHYFLIRKGDLRLILLGTR